MNKEGAKKIVNGREYEWQESYKRWEAIEAEEIPPAIVCDCGATYFQVSYGFCDLICHCVCGKQFTVYDG